MNDNLENGKSILELIGKNKFVYFVVYYSTVIWFLFLSKKEADYKYINEVKKFLVDYNELFLFISVVSIVIVITIKSTYHDHGWGITYDGDNTVAVKQLINANRLESFSGVLFITILPISLYYDLNNSIKYIGYSSITILVVVSLSKSLAYIKSRKDKY